MPKGDITVQFVVEFTPVFPTCGKEPERPPDGQPITLDPDTNGSESSPVNFPHLGMWTGQGYEVLLKKVFFQLSSTTSGAYLRTDINHSCGIDRLYSCPAIMLYEY